MQGRAHFYEGYSLADVVFPVRVMRALGAPVLLVSNAAGGINRLWSSGDLMIIADHINFTGSNPLMGPNDPDLGPRFPDMSQAYEPELIALAERAALAEGIPIRKGVYAGVHGPSYETPAELRMLRGWGADAVGMSTVPEVIAARHMAMRVLGITAITDMATGEQVKAVTHEDVIAVARELEPKFIRLVKRIVKEMTWCVTSTWTGKTDARNTMRPSPRTSWNRDGLEMAPMLRTSSAGWCDPSMRGSSTAWLRRLW